MAERLIDQRIEEIARAVRVRGRYRDRVLDELRTHLEESAADGERHGLTHDEAVRTAIDRLGSVDAIADDLLPRQTQRTRLFATLPILGLCVAAASLRAANALHANGDQLWSSPLYTGVWLVGWLSIVLLCGSLISLFSRHRGVLGLVGRESLAFSFVAAAALLAFHFANDGSLDRGDPDRWRLLAIGSAILALAAMLNAMKRVRILPTWPLALGAAGVAMIGLHYSVVHRGSLALAGAGLVSAAGVALTLLLVKDRPLT